MKRILLFCSAVALFAGDPVRMEWNVNGTAREALLCAPESSGSANAPLIFVFHGHGGTMGHAVESFAFHRAWPEAVVVYPQGLNTPGKLTDPQGKKSGWQSGIGAMDDRDLHFFDAMLDDLAKKYRIDRKRVFATGHSNGGSFTYLLWAARGSIFAAVAPMASLLGDEKERALLAPKPVFHSAGRKDPLVKFAWQEMMMKYVRTLNACSDGAAGPDARITIYPSTNRTPLVTYIHDGAHEMPKDAIPFIVQFFKEIGGR